MATTTEFGQNIFSPFVSKVQTDIDINITKCYTTQLLTS